MLIIGEKLVVKLESFLELIPKHLLLVNMLVLTHSEYLRQEHKVVILLLFNVLAEVFSVSSFVVLKENIYITFLLQLHRLIHIPIEILKDFHLDGLGDFRIT